MLNIDKSTKLGFTSSVPVRWQVLDIIDLANLHMSSLQEFANVPIILEKK